MSNYKESVNTEWNNSWDNFQTAKDTLEKAVLEYEETVFEYEDSPSLYNEMTNGMNDIWGFLCSRHQESAMSNGMHEELDFEYINDEMFGISIRRINNKYHVFFNVSGNNINLEDESTFNSLFGLDGKNLTKNLMAFGKSVLEYIGSSNKRYESLNPPLIDVSFLLENINVGSRNDITSGYHKYNQNILAEIYDPIIVK